MNRFLTHTILIIVFAAAGCGCSSDETIIVQTNAEAKTVEVIKLSRDKYGFWVSKKYLTNLEKTKSTKKAQEMGADMISIDGSQEIMMMTIHEDGAQNIIIMQTESIGQVYSSDSTKKYDEIRFEGNELSVGNEQYIHASSLHARSSNDLINSTFIANNYDYNGKEVVFDKEGSIKGMDGIISYSLNLDYIDAGMQFDKIFLKYEGEDERRTFLYEFVSDTLFIYELDCIVQSEDSDYCLDVNKGPLKFKLVKD